MDTSAIAILLYYILCLVLALTVVALTIFYKRRLPYSKGARELKRESGQREESAHEEKAESRAVLSSSSGRGIQKQAVSAGEKALKPEPAAREVPSEAQKTGKAGKQIELIGIRKRVQQKNISPVNNSEPKVSLKDDSVSHISLASASQGQAAITESKIGEKPAPEPLPGEQIERTEVQEQIQEKNTAPIRHLQPKGPIKAYSGSQYTTITDVPQGQLIGTEPKTGVKTTLESSPGNTSQVIEKEDPSRIAEPTQANKTSEAGMDAGSGTEVDQAGSEPPAATEDSGEAEQEMPQKQKSGLGDLADLFATSAADFIEKNRLAEEVNDVDINELLKEGLGLLGKVKKSGD